MNDKQREDEHVERMLKLHDQNNAMQRHIALLDQIRRDQEAALEAFERRLAEIQERKKH